MISDALTRPGAGFDLRDYVWFWPGVAVALLVAVVASGWLGRAIRRPRPIAFGLVFGLGLIAAATLTPSRDALLFGIPGSGRCDLSVVALPTLAELRSLNDTSLNVSLFVPLGVAVGLAAMTRRTVLLLPAALAVPFAIEAIQLVVTPLGRTCQSVDVLDNLTGLLAGLVVAGLATAVTRMARGARLEAEDPTAPRP